MVEPVGTTLAAVGILYPLYQACDDLYHGYKLTRSFGDDFDLVQLALEMQYSRLEKTSQTRDVELQGLDRPSDINNANHRVTGTVHRTLSQIKIQFELANKLLSYYDQKEREHDSSTQVSYTTRTSEAVEPSQSTSDFTTPSTTPDAPGADASRVEREKLKVSKKKKKNRILGGLGLGKKHKKAVAPEGTPLSTLASQHPAAAALLNADEVVGANHNSAKNSEHRAHSTGFFKKALWAKEDRKTMLRIIEVLNYSNNYLENILELKAPRNIERLVNLPGDDVAWLTEARDVQRALKRLHESLRHLNTSNEEHGPWYLSIQLMKDFGEYRQWVVDNLTNLPLRTGGYNRAYYFSFLRQRNPESQASFLIAETTQTYIPGGQESSIDTDISVTKSAWHLDQAKGLSKTRAIEGFTKWGSVWIEARKKDVHMLYHAEEQQTAYIANLVSLLRAHETQAYMASYRKVGLAALIAKSYLHLSLVRTSCAEIQPSSFRYFGEPGEEVAWNDNKPLILEPYLEIGFGRKRDNGNFSNRVVASESQDWYIVGLGLLLYQVGCCLVLDYTQGISELRKAQKIASADLHQLDYLVSPKFAEIVQGCLQYPVASAGGNAGSESRFVEGVVSELFQLQVELQ